MRLQRTPKSRLIVRAALQTVIATLVAVLLSSGTADAALIGLSSSSTGGVYSIDPATGTATLIVATSPTSLVGATFLGGTLYGSDVCVPCFSVASIDMTTGTATFVSNQDGSSNWHGLASNESAGLMYSIDINDNNILKTLTPSGGVTAIGPGNAGVDGRGMAYADTTGTLYATGGNSLYRVATTTGIATLIGPMGIETSGRIGLAFDPTAAILYANVGTTVGALYTLDTLTGAATLVGLNGVPSIDGLAWTPDSLTAVPEPAALTLVGTALGALAFRRRRPKIQQVSAN